MFEKTLNKLTTFFQSNLLSISKIIAKSFFDRLQDFVIGLTLQMLLQGKEDSKVKIFEFLKYIIKQQ